MRFWDSSALAAIFLQEAGSAAVQTLIGTDSEVTVWSLTSVELYSAVARRRRENPADAAATVRTHSEILAAWNTWTKVSDVEAVRSFAERLVMSHPLRAADALQLGAALAAADDDPAALEFVTLDRRLADAARRQGFPVLGSR